MAYYLEREGPALLEEERLRRQIVETKLLRKQERERLRERALEEERLRRQVDEINQRRAQELLVIKERLLDGDVKLDR